MTSEISSEDPIIAENIQLREENEGYRRYYQNTMVALERKTDFVQAENNQLKRKVSELQNKCREYANSVYSTPLRISSNLPRNTHCVEDATNTTFKSTYLRKTPSSEILNLLPYKKNMTSSKRDVIACGSLQSRME
jgi:predicted RNase H-like nuclease (RuvC/YqgF family)